MLKYFKIFYLYSNLQDWRRLRGELEEERRGRRELEATVKQHAARLQAMDPANSWCGTPAVLPCQFAMPPIYTLTSGLLGCDFSDWQAKNKNNIIFRPELYFHGMSMDFQNVT